MYDSVKSDKLYKISQGVTKAQKDNNCFLNLLCVTIFFIFLKFFFKIIFQLDLSLFPSTSSLEKEIVNFGRKRIENLAEYIIN